MGCPAPGLADAPAAEQLVVFGGARAGSRGCRPVPGFQAAWWAAGSRAVLRSVSGRLASGARR